VSQPKSSDSITSIKGIGKTFEKDFARIGLNKISDFKNKNPEVVFEKLVVANLKEQHKTSKLYLYVIRMLVYIADGGEDWKLMSWNKWKD
jgi:Pathogenicity locus